MRTYVTGKKKRNAMRQESYETSKKIITMFSSITYLINFCTGAVVVSVVVCGVATVTVESDKTVSQSCHNITRTTTMKISLQVINEESTKTNILGCCVRLWNAMLRL